MPKFLFKRHDGGADSGVTAYNLIEWKRGFSIALLRFSPNHREAYHTHAFNALTWWLRGSVIEEYPYKDKPSTVWNPSWRYKVTPRSLMHRIRVCNDVAWAFTIRGRWVDHWLELREQRLVTLTHGRKVVSSTEWVDD